MSTENSTRSTLGAGPEFHGAGGQGCVQRGNWRSPRSWNQEGPEESWALRLGSVYSSAGSEQRDDGKRFVNSESWGAAGASAVGRRDPVGLEPERRAGEP